MSIKKKMLQAAAGVGGAGLNVEEVFSTYLYEGNGSTQTITNDIDLDGEGGLVWIKERVDTTRHLLFDTERGVYKYISSNRTDGEASSSSSLTNFNSDGFSIDTNGMLNDNTKDFASWTFRKAPKFFDVVTYTGTGTAQTIAHNLGTTVGSILIKCTSLARNWAVYHKGLSDPSEHYLILNSTTGAVTHEGAQFWNSTLPTDSVFSVGTNANVNLSGATYVAYLFAHNDGDGEFGGEADADIIKCGSYTGNGLGSNNDGLGLEIDLGFEPQWVMIKSSTWSSGDWMMFDSMRGMSTGTGGDNYLNANQTYAEAPDTMIAATPTGFKLESDNYSVNASIHNYIYIAIRRGTKVPESGTEVFAIQQSDGTSDPAFSAGFPIDAALLKATTVSNGSMRSRLTGTGFLETNSTGAEGTNGFTEWDYQDSWFSSNLSSSYYSWMWKRAPGYFDVVAYSGDGNVDPGQQLNHNLGVAPEMIWVKSRTSAVSWECWFNGFTTDEYIRLNSDGGKSSNSGYPRFPVLPTETTFNVGGGSSANGSNEDYIAYLFASLPGISKVGSYAGNDGTQTIDCGFTTGARFILIKKTDGGDWFVWDTERGINAASDPYLTLNTTDAQNPGQDEIDAHASGFIINSPGGSGDAEINKSGKTYIFYAIA